MVEGFVLVMLCRAEIIFLQSKFVLQFFGQVDRLLFFSSSLDLITNALIQLLVHPIPVYEQLMHFIYFINFFFLEIRKKVSAHARRAQLIQR